MAKFTVGLIPKGEVTEVVVEAEGVAEAEGLAIAELGGEDNLSKVLYVMEHEGIVTQAPVAKAPLAEVEVSEDFVEAPVAEEED